MENKNVRYHVNEHVVQTVSFQSQLLTYLIISVLIYLAGYHVVFKTSYLLPIKNGVLILLFTALTPMLQRVFLLSSLQLKRAWTYRMALLVSANCGASLWILQLFDKGGAGSFLLLASVLCGAFWGGLSITSWDYGLAEFNGSPSRQVKEVVYRRHREILPGISRETWLKHTFDVGLAVISLVAFMPVMLFIAFLIWWEDPGPIIFIKNSVGRGGINFLQFKLRTMVRNAEKDTGPILASKNDHRFLRIGKFLRLTALDEFPQLINILRGEMSLVGPRPQRTILVHDYLQALPQYALRHAVRPGLAGLSQVMGHYHITPLQKLRFDRLYVRNASFFLDLKIIISAILIVFWLRFRNSWDGDYFKTLRKYRGKK